MASSSGIEIDGERPGVGVLAIMVIEALRRLGVRLVAEEAAVPVTSFEPAVTHGELRDTLAEVLAEGNVTVEFVPLGQ